MERIHIQLPPILIHKVHYQLQLILKQAKVDFISMLLRGFFTADYRVGSLSDDGATSSARSNSVEVTGNTGTTSPVTDSQGSHTHTFSGSHGPSEHAYADFMIATKD